MGLRPGSRFAFNAAAQGKVVLAFGPPHIATRVYDNPLPRVTPRTITKAAVLTDEIRRCREDGWAEAPDELFLGINALAAPLFYPDRSLMGTLAIVGFTEALRGSKRKKALRKLISTAAEISASLAGPDRPDPV
ncbi:MAG: IclR family transcriptional regulator C-terminal domain-containing protein [Pseudolabrys sp.]|nr:IclR family transcriptional regulator C-terminal domain-containing protein [Pseudolabrys sp.]